MYQKTFLKIAADLAETGYSLTDEVFSRRVVAALHAFFESESAKDSFQPAMISGHAEKRREQKTRGDLTHWLSEADFALPGLSPYAEFFSALTLALNRDLFLGINHRDFHFSLYPTGSFYVTHLDQAKRSSGRKITFIHYLNPNWKSGDGGELRLYLDDERSRYLDVEPVWGRCLFFVSDRFYHEVLPVLGGGRRSLSGWFSG